jgi:hypothetical protein
MKTIHIKYLAIAFIVIVSIAVYAAVGGKGSLQGDKSTNVVVIKKKKLMFPAETVGAYMYHQKFCVNAKIALAQAKGQTYSPSSEEILTKDQILAFFDDSTIEEYYQGVSYSKIEKGNTIDAKNLIDDSKANDDIEKFKCKYKKLSYEQFEIKKINQTISGTTTKDGGRVEVLNLSKEVQVTPSIPGQLPIAKTLDVGSSKFKCDLTALDMQQCYLSGMHFHSSSGIPVIPQMVALESGSKLGPQLVPFDAVFAEFGGTVRGGALAMIEENISITVGEPISKDKFEIPVFAKSFKTKVKDI